MNNQDTIFKILDLKKGRIRTIKINTILLDSSKGNFGAYLMKGFIDELINEKRMLGHQNINITEEMIDLINSMGDVSGKIQIFTDTNERIFLNTDGSCVFIPKEERKPRITFLSKLKTIFKRKLKHQSMAIKNEDKKC